ncbi:MAG TPA: glycosyltransferase family 4 protein [Acidimicrobiales bacterium]|nr:glycosyltransferase family 4 protein [Acidimicrobiales bacterium]
MSRHLLVTNDFPPKVGGIQSYLWELWRRLDPDSFAVLTASSHPDHAAFDAEQAAAGFRIERTRGRILYLPTPSTVRRIRRLADAVGASLVVLDPVLPLGLVGPHLGLPYAVVVHGAEITVPGRLPVSRQAMAHVLRHAALVVSAGPYPAAEADRAARGVLPPVVDVPPGVESSQFLPLDAPGRVEARRRLGLPVDGLLVVSVSRLVPRKGMDVLVKAAGLLAPSIPDLTVAIGGSGRDAARLGRIVADVGAPVRLLGRLSEEDKGLLMGAADVFALACRNRWFGLEQEGFGIVFVEAASAGVPQVAGRSGGAADAVEDAVTGLLVRHPERPGDVALTLRRLLLDPALRRRMGEAGRQRVLASFDYDGLAPRLARALAEVAG